MLVAILAALVAVTGCFCFRKVRQHLKSVIFVGLVKLWWWWVATCAAGAGGRGSLVVAGCFRCSEVGQRLRLLDGVALGQASVLSSLCPS